MDNEFQYDKMYDRDYRARARCTVKTPVTYTNACTEQYALRARITVTARVKVSRLAVPVSDETCGHNCSKKLL